MDRAASLMKPLAAPSSDEVERARQLIMQHGWNAVCYQILNPGFALWFSSRGDAVAGYVRRLGVWVVGGAPVCSHARLGEVVEEFEAAARRDNCTTCYFGAGLRLYADCTSPPQYSVAALGAQPSWNPSRWSEIIARRASVRAQLNRATNKGVRILEWNRDLRDIKRFQELHECLNQWIRRRPMPTMHFLVEPDTLHHLKDRRVWIAERGDSIVGFLVASPVPVRHGWLIEQIIRGNAAPNGTSELLLHHAITQFAAAGVHYVTLGLVPLSTRADEFISGNPAWLRLLIAWARAHGNRFYNFSGLETFKSKFKPEAWEPIFAIANTRHFSPRTVYAIAAAFSDHSSPLLHGVGAIYRAGRQELRWLSKK